jgi:hypothetical protein
VAVWTVLAYCVARSLVRGGRAWLNAASALVGRTVVVASMAGAAITLLLTLPPWLSTPARAAQADRWLMFLLLIPQAVAIAIPAGLCFAVAVTMRGRRLNPRQIGPTAGLVLIAVGLTLATLEWLVPEANQAFRQLTFGDGAGRGLHELGLTALARRSDAASVNALHVRLSLAAATVSLTALPMALLSRWRLRRWHAALIGVVAPMLYLACAWSLATRFGSRAPLLSAWGPNLLLLALASALLCAGWRRSAAAIDPARRVG